MSACGVTCGVPGGTGAHQLPHLFAELEKFLPQVLQALHGGLAHALHLPSGRGQVAVDQAAHGLLIALISLLPLGPALLDKHNTGRKASNHFLQECIIEKNNVTSVGSLVMCRRDF